MDYKKNYQIEGIKFLISSEYQTLYQENHKITVLISDIMNLMKSIYFSFDHELKITTDSSKEKITGKIMINELKKLNSKDGMIKFEILKEFILKLSIKYPEILFDVICNSCDNISINSFSSKISSIAVLPSKSNITSTNFSIRQTK